MAYNTRSLAKDASNQPVPQYYNDLTDAYEVIKGANGSINTQLTGSKVQDVTLLSNVSTTGAGTPQLVGGFKSLRLEVWGTATSFTIQIQVNESNGSGTYYPIQVTNLASMTLVSNITAAGIYEIDVAGFSNVQANVTAVTGGNVSAAGKWVA
jgi:hypothetical protein